jgi:hypothetical protein
MSKASVAYRTPTWGSTSVGFLVSSESYDDPHFEPPADIAGAEARAYEDKIIESLRESLLPSPGPVILLDSVERRGERPDTEIVFHYHDTRFPGQRFARRARLWKDGWPFDENEAVADRLHEAASVAGWINAAWFAGELEQIESGPPD